MSRWQIVRWRYGPWRFYVVRDAPQFSLLVSVGPIEIRRRR